MEKKKKLKTLKQKLLDEAFPYFLHQLNLRGLLKEVGIGKEEKKKKRKKRKKKRKKRKKKGKKKGKKRKDTLNFFDNN